MVDHVSSFLLWLRLRQNLERLPVTSMEVNEGFFVPVTGC